MTAIDVTKLKAGDEDALRSFYDVIVPKIRHVVIFTLKDRVETEDVVEEIISRILSNFEVVFKFEDPLKIEAYCLKVARNIALEFRRQLQKEDRKVEISESYLNQIPVGTVVSAEDVLSLSLTLKEALETLPELDRQLILQYYMGGATLHEISERLGVPLATVRSRLYRTIARLRQVMTSE